MEKRRFSGRQIPEALERVEADLPVPILCHGRLVHPEMPKGSCNGKGA
jgi:hypothetical protein